MKPFLIAILALACLSACQQHADNNRTKKDSTTAAVKTITVQSGDLHAKLQLNGKIAADEERRVKLYSLVSGKTDRILVETGDYVRKGQVLATVRSPEAAAFSREVETATSDLDLALAEKERAAIMFDSKLINQQEYLQAVTNWKKAVTALEKARQMESITGSQGERYEIRSPINGYVTAKHITGQSMLRPDNSTELFEIADLSTVWLMANVFESDIQAVQAGEQVEARTLAHPDKVYKGKIDKIYQVLDPETRAMKVRVRIANPQQELKPEMFAQLTVIRGHALQGLSIPANVIIFHNSREYVVLQNDSGYSSKRITVKDRIGDTCLVDGLQPGDRVVTEQQLYLFQSLQP